MPPGAQDLPWWPLLWLLPCLEAGEGALSIAWRRMGLIRSGAERPCGLGIIGCTLALDSRGVHG